jgi:peptide/nickel transport system substrate-binding protein
MTSTLLSRALSAGILLRFRHEFWCVEPLNNGLSTGTHLSTRYALRGQMKGRPRHTGVGSGQLPRCPRVRRAVGVRYDEKDREMRRSACLILVAVIATMSVVLAACGGQGGGAATPEKPGGNGAGTGAPVAGKTGGKLTVVWANDAELIDCGESYYQMDWMLCWSTQRPLYNYKPDDGTHMVPDLAASPPEVSADGKTVSVAIRSGVKFSPPVSREVTSHDVKYAIERGYFNTVNNGYVGAYFNDIDGAKIGVKPGTTISGLETPDNRTIIFHLTKPTGGVFAAGALAMPITAPVPEEYARKFDSRSPSGYGQAQVATGPYMIQNDAKGDAIGYKPGRSIHLVRNPNWAKNTDFKPAYLDEIENTTGQTDTTVSSRQILVGQGMITGDFSPPPEILKQAQTSRQKDQLIVSPGTGGRWVSMNTSIKPFDDINVRKAVIAGFDRNALRLSRGGRLVGGMATHFLSPTIAGFAEAGGNKGPGFDFMNDTGRPNPQLSSDYFRKAGYPSGKYTGGESILMVGDNSGVAAKAAEVTKQNFENMGFNVTLRLVTHESMYAKFCNVPAAKVAVCPNVGFVADFADGQTLLDPTFNGKNILKLNNSNWSQLNVPQINQDMDKAKQLTDPAARAKAWAQADRDITAQAPAIPWLWDNTPVLVSKNVNTAISEANGGIVDLNFSSLK